MAIPQLAGTSSATQTSAAAGITINYPASSKSGDLLLMSVEFYKTVAGAYTVTTPTSWNLIESSNQSTGTGRYYVVFWRFRGAETSVTVNTNSSVLSLAQMQAYKGDINQTTPIGTAHASTYTAATSTAHTLPSVTTPDSDFAMAGFIHSNRSSLTTAYTNNWTTNMYEQLDTGVALNSLYHSMSNAYEYALYGSGATGTRAVATTNTSINNFMCTVAIMSAKTGPTNRGTNTVMNGSTASADLVGTYGSGDFFVVATCFRKTSAGAFTVATPAGFTLIGSSDHSASDGSRVDIFYGWRTGGATSVTVSASTATGMLGMLNIISLPNDGLSVDVTDPIGPVSINYSATASATSTIASATTTVPMTLCHLVEFDWDSAALFGYAHLWTQPVQTVPIYNAETNVPWNSTRTFSQSSAVDYCETPGSTGSAVVTDATTATPPVANGRTFAPYYGIRVCIQPPHIQTITDGDTGSGSDNAAVGYNPADTDTGAGSDVAGTVKVSGAVDTSTSTVEAATQRISGAVDTNTSSTDTAGVAAQVPVTDTGSGVDAATILVVVQGVDTGAGADTATVKITGAVDSGSGVDNGITLIGTDAGTGTDVATQRTYDTDTGLATDSAFVSQALQVNDTALGTDTATVFVTATTDTGTGTEFVVPFVVDAGIGLETNAIRTSDADTGSGVDNAFATNAAIVSDTALGSDTATVVVRPTGDSGAGVEQATGFGADTGSGADSATLITVINGDTGLAVDNASSKNLATSSDSGVHIDTATTAPQVITDTGAGADTASLNAKAITTDVGLSADNATVIVIQSDSGLGVDNGKLGMSVTDTGSGLDTATIAVFVFGFDTGLGTDNLVTIGVRPTGDTNGPSIESAVKSVNGFLDAPRVTIVIPESRTAMIERESRGIAVDSELRLVVIGFEVLRTIVIDAENRSVTITKES